MNKLTELQNGIKVLFKDSEIANANLQRDIEALKEENERLMKENTKLLKENEFYRKQGVDTSCPNCATYQRKIEVAEVKLKILYKKWKIFGSYLGNSNTEQNSIPDNILQHFIIDESHNHLTESGAENNSFLSGSELGNKVDSHSDIAEPIQTNKQVLTEEKIKNNVIDPSKAHERSDKEIYEVIREVEELSSIELDSQFVIDGGNVNECREIENEETPGIVEETPVKISRRQKFGYSESRTAERVLEQLFGPVTQSSRSSRGSDVIVPESPERDANSPPQPSVIIPDTHPMLQYATTPVKFRNGISTEAPSLQQGIFDKKTECDGQSRVESVVYSLKRAISVDKLPPKLPINQLLSPPPKNSEHERKRSLESTPKRKKLSPKKRLSRTPGKKALKKTYRIEAEISNSGVRKLTQTQLNVACFKRPPSHENRDTSAKSLEEDLDSQLNEDIVTYDNSPPRLLRSMMKQCGSNAAFTPPFTNIENQADCDETRLSTSAIRRIADDVVTAVLSKPELHLPSSYDKVSVLAQNNLGRKELRKALPGQECLECEKFYAMFDNGEEKRRALDRCSRHRTRNQIVSATPEGFWKPLLTQTPPHSP